MDESEIVLNRHDLVSIVGQEIEEKVPLKPPETSPLTISCVSSTNFQIKRFIFMRNYIKVDLRLTAYLFVLERTTFE